MCAEQCRMLLHTRQRGIVYVLFLASAGWACARSSTPAVGTGSSPEHSTRSYEVTLKDEAPYFRPYRLPVPVGAIVLWHNRGPALSHSIRLKDGNATVHSGRIRPGTSWSHTFKHEALLRVNCEIHPYMQGFLAVGSVHDTAAAEMSAPATAGAQLTSARIREFTMPVPNSVPGIVAVDKADNVWFTMGGGGWANIEHPPLGKIGRLRPAGQVQVYDLPTPASGPSGLAIGPDGIIHITELMAGKIARFDPVLQTFTEFQVPTPNAWPTGLALDSAGNLWFNQTKGNKLGRLTGDGVISEIPVPTPRGNPTGMVIDADNTVWFAERDGNKIGRLTPSGSLLEYMLPTPRAKPAGMAVDPQGRIWFAQRAGNKIGVIDRGKLREYPLPQPHSGPFFVAIDGQGMVWFSETYGNRIGKLDPRSGAITEYPVPTPDSWPGGLAFDSRGNVWFTEQLGNKVAVLFRSQREYSASPQSVTSETRPSE